MTPNAPSPQTQSVTGSVRSRHLFRQITKARPIPPDELPHYQAQAREVLEKNGSDYLDQWLQAWLDIYQSDAARRTQPVPA